MAALSGNTDTNNTEIIYGTQKNVLSLWRLCTLY